MAQRSFISRQRGITLMEIMISMGIALIGIMGIMAMMPLAATNLSKGIEADAASTFGRGALHQLTSRDIIQGEWITSAVDNNGNFRLDNNDNALLDRWEPDHPLRVARSFCFDPQHLGEYAAFAGESNLPSLVNVSPTSVGMPYFGFNNEPGYSHPRMFRASLPMFPGTASVRPIIPALADHICEGQDDLAFERPKDNTLPPLQTFSRFNDVNPNADDWQKAPRLRQSHGRFSWMATVVPEIDNGGAIGDEFRRLSIVVFHDRIIDPSLGPTQTGVDHQELLFDVILVGGGVAGGDVTLVTRPGRPEADLQEIRQGDWIMLGGTVFTASLPQQFRWYRVVDSSANSLERQDYDGRTVFSREVTLVGPDWMRPEWLGYDMSQSPADNANLNTANASHYMRTQATWVRGVVSVLEKNIAVDAHDH